MIKLIMLQAGLQQQNIDVSKLDAGVCTVLMETGKDTEIIKVIKQ